MSFLFSDYLLFLSWFHSNNSLGGWNPIRLFLVYSTPNSPMASLWLSSRMHFKTSLDCNFCNNFLLLILDLEDFTIHFFHLESILSSYQITLMYTSFLQSPFPLNDPSPLLPTLLSTTTLIYSTRILEVLLGFSFTPLLFFSFFSLRTKQFISWSFFSIQQSHSDVIFSTWGNSSRKDSTNQNMGEESISRGWSFNLTHCSDDQSITDWTSFSLLSLFLPPPSLYISFLHTSFYA